MVCDERTPEAIAAEKELIRRCFDDGVSYDFGGYIDYDVADSVFACQKHCQAHADCAHFSYYKSTNKCYRKLGNKKKSVEEAISGPRNCSDPNYTLSPGYVTSTPKSCEAPGTVCLKGGRNNNQGNVFVGDLPICDDDWTLTNANVVCKQLGFIGALQYTKESRFGSTSSNFVMDQGWKFMSCIVIVKSCVNNHELDTDWLHKL